MTNNGAFPARARRLTPIGSLAARVMPHWLVLSARLPHNQSYWRVRLSFSHNRGIADNIMAAIPGGYLSPSRYWLPSPETASDATHEVRCVLPRFGAVRITNQRMTHKRQDA